MSPTLAQLVAVENLSPGEYVSKFCPIRLGNSMPIAYGGCTIAVAVSAAIATVPSSHLLYSVLGHFHGPASTDLKLYCSVQSTRDTRSFATRRVQIKQKQADGKSRTCLELLADFHVEEPSHDDLTYSAPPRASYAKPEDCPTMKTQQEALEARGSVAKSESKQFSAAFGILDEYFETRVCTNGVSSQNLSGAAKNTVTTQDHRHITAKETADWQKTKAALISRSENFAVLAFVMDGGLSFLPLSHGHLWFDDVAACSTLDFSLRIFTADVKMDEWKLKEKTTSRGGAGRTYTEGRLWDERGHLVASMTQQSIMRPKKGSGKPSL
ncbi:hypothetical protein G7046_g3936 [Stylonectria norvegica]|nr:hypothetical protein G7046_g3936 [Stylonectria norvegica]